MSALAAVLTGCGGDEVDPVAACVEDLAEITNSIPVEDIETGDETAGALAPGIDTAELEVIEERCDRVFTESGLSEQEILDRYLDALDPAHRVAVTG